MDYKETDLNFLYDDLSREYGKKQAELLYSLMCQKYTDLCKYEIRFENDEMNEHIFNRILPTEYYGAAEPPVRCGESHLSGLTEPPHFVY